MRDSTADHRLVLVYIPLAFVGILELTVVGSAGSEWLRYGLLSLPPLALMFFVPMYVVYWRAVRRVRRVLRHGERTRATVARIGASNAREIVEIHLTMSVLGRPIQTSLVVHGRPAVAPGDRIEAVVERSRRRSAWFCALIPGVGPRMGRYRRAALPRAVERTR